MRILLHMSQRTLKSVQDDLTESLRAATAHEEYDVEQMKKAAGLLIDFRLMFNDSHGRPDLGGKSYGYRQAIADVVTGAGIVPMDKGSVMAAVRYHAGNILRDRYTAEELADYGLLPVKPVQRQQAERAANSRALRAAENGNEKITDLFEIQKALRMSANLLDSVEIKGLSKVDRKMVDFYLLHLRERLTEITP